MKKQFIALVAAMSVISACDSEEIEIAPEVNGEGVYATVEQPNDLIDTRSLTWGDSSFGFTWSKGESVVVFGEGEPALLSSLTFGDASAKFESKGFKLMDGINYHAFIPAYNFVITSKNTAIPVTYVGQRQTANNNTDHLKYFDYACATATKEEGKNSVSFELKNQVAWLVIEHRFTEETKNVTSITVSVPEKIFMATGTLDATKSTIKGKTFSSSITLDLGNEGEDGISFVAGELFRAFITANPVDLSGKAINITANKSDGSSIDLGTYSKDGVALKINTPLRLKTTGTTSENVASFDGRSFSTLSAAFNAVPQASAGIKTITLLADVKENVVLNDTRRTFNGSLYTTILDMAGHSITAETGNAITVKSGELDIKKGTINSLKKVGVIFDPEADGARVTLRGCTVNAQESAVATSTASNSRITIQGGNYTAADNAVILGNGNTNHNKFVDGVSTDTGIAREKANRITIESSATYGVPVLNGKIQTEGYVACGIYAPWKDIINVNAGIFNIENGVGILSRGGKVTINDAQIVTSEPSAGYKGKVGDSRVVVPCKTMFIDRECGYSDVENATIIIKGGKYSDNTGAAYNVPDGYVYAETGKTPLAYEIVVGGDKLIDAINNVTENGTVTVDNYASLKNKPAAIKKNFNLEVAENAVITAGYSNYYNTLNYCLENGIGTITGNGTIEGPKAASSAAIWVNATNQTLTIDGNVTVKGGEYTNTNNDNATAANIYNGKLVINNGTFISGIDVSGNNSPAIYLTPRAGETAVLEINGGVFKSVSGNAEFLINCDDGATSRCQISIKGGTFYGFNPADNNADGAHTNYVAEGYVVIKNGDEYTVVKAHEVTDETSLKKAITSSKTAPVLVNSTIELESSYLSLTNGYNLVVGEKGKITPSSSYRSDVGETISTANKTGTVNISGSGSIEGPSNSTDGNGACAIEIMGSNTSSTKLTVNIYGNLTVKGGSGGEANNAVTIINGIANIYGGYFYAGLDKNNDPSEKVQVIYLRPGWKQNATLNIYDGVFECAGDPAFLINCLDSSVDANKCTINVTGGVFVGFDPSNSAADKINGKNANWVPDGYVSKEITYNGKQAWEVTKAE